jgi:hypothetical protein
VFRGLQVPHGAERGGRREHGTVVRRRVGPGLRLRPTRFAAVAGACTAAGYAAIGVVAGLWLGTQMTTAPVGGLVYWLAVAVPAAVAAAYY